MSGTLDRWFVSGPIGVGSDFSEAVDAHSGGTAAWGAAGSVLRHDGADTLNLVDGRKAAGGQGPTLSLWGMNAASKAVRLGAVGARFAATADGGSSAYLSLFAKGAGGDVIEAVRVGSDRVTSFLAPGTAATVVVGAGGNGKLRVRHIDGKDHQGDANDGLFLNWDTGKQVVVGGPEVNSHLTVHGDLLVRRFPANDATPSLTGFSLVNRGPGGGERAWTLYTAAVGGGYGATQNGFDIWEYPVSQPRLRIRPGGDTVLAPAGGNVGIGNEAPQARLHVSGGDLRIDGGRTIYANGRMHINGEEVLYLQNRAGVTVQKHANGTGDLRVEGLLGVNGQSPSPRTRGWGGGIHTWDIEVEGSAWCRNGWQSGPRDLAENFETAEPTEPGVVVSFDPEHNVVVPSTRSNDTLVCGVVSTDPGLLLNSDPDRPEYETLAPVALSGRVPCQVVDENGPIRRGDLLTSSSVRGHAMRAAPVDLGGQHVYRSGTIVGKALENHEGGRGLIDIFVLHG